MLRKSRHFLLVEILVAMAILGMGLAFLGQLAIQGSRIGRNNQALTQSALLAQEKMEEVFLLADSSPLTLGTQSGGGQSSQSSYQWKRTISQHDPARPGLFGIKVTVAYSANAASPLISLNSVLYQPPTRSVPQ
jgi:type II secretory pathway pseudopilin PulG